MRPMVLPLATAAVYCIPAWLPNAPLAFYIGRGWLGCLFAWALYGGTRIGPLTLVSLLAWEGSSSLCGALYAHMASAAWGSLCDKGTGLPMTLPSLALTLAAVAFEHNTKRGSTSDA